MDDLTTANWLIAIGGFLFFMLGALHFRMTLADIKDPKKFAPAKRELLKELQETRMAFRKNLKSFWTSSLGFHFSHSIGVMFYALVVIYCALARPDILDDMVVRIGIIAVGASYVILSQAFWFSIPLIGTALGVSLIAVGMALL